MREKQGYRAELEALNEYFPDKNELKAIDLINYCHISRNTFKKRYPAFVKGGSKTAFAAERCKR